MSAFDVTITPINFQLQAVPNEKGEATELQMVVMVGILLPFQQAPGQPPPVAPIGVVRVPLNKELAENLGDSLKAEAEKMVKPSTLEVATGLDAEALKKAAAVDGKLRNG